MRGHHILHGVYILLALPLALLACAFVLVNLRDDPPNPEYASFFHAEKPVPESQNGHYAMCGIRAPAGVNVVKYGKAVDAGQDTSAFGKPMDIATPDDDYACAASQSLPSSTTTCAKPADVRRMLQKNRLPLQRYRALRAYPHQVSEHTISYCSSADFMTLARMEAAAMAQELADGRAEAAYTEWRAELSHQQKVFADPQSFVGKAVNMVVIGIDLKFLPVMLRKYPGIARSHAREIEALLDVKPFGPGSWDVAATMRKEAQVFAITDQIDNMGVMGLSFFFKPNATNNLKLGIAKDFIALAGQPLDKFDAAEAAMVDKYEHPGILARLRNIGGGMLIRQELVTHELLRNATRKYAFRRMLMLYTHAKAAGVSAGAMPAFIKSEARKGLLNPLTDKPFRWDEKAHTLQIEEPDGQVVPAFQIIY